MSEDSAQIENEARINPERQKFINSFVNTLNAIPSLNTFRAVIKRTDEKRGILEIEDFARDEDKEWVIDHIQDVTHVQVPEKGSPEEEVFLFGTTDRSQRYVSFQFDNIGILYPYITQPLSPEAQRRYERRYDRSYEYKPEVRWGTLINANNGEVDEYARSHKEDFAPGMEVRVRLSQRHRTHIYVNTLVSRENLQKEEELQAQLKSQPDTPGV